MSIAQRPQDRYFTPANTTNIANISSDIKEKKEHKHDANNQLTLDQDSLNDSTKDELILRNLMPPLTLSFAPRGSIVANDILTKSSSSKLSKRIYNKASLSSLLNRTTRSFRATNRLNYEDLHCRSKSKDHTHIIRVL